jgi:hypothetical protein
MPTIRKFPAAPWRVCAITVLPQCQLAVTFNDGNSGIVDVSALVLGQDAGVFKLCVMCPFLRKHISIVAL